ncbi:[formate-C-acetyltransferase]-activating enzyme [Vibrio mediterranei]|uniref:[formate-C-acetyltransferase]-activating enzyme n=1 Tax=Vibrio mediterranei TaxID=689 RepID=A0AAN1FIF6_9VIBR|nr:[formate-C-acetyltransferase]-activating enzyme [Vibrio mediterranei]ASI91224.1 [formate-C-acetyltransferase]-activating enzyme [Vibrio mediterranei]
MTLSEEPLMSCNCQTSETGCLESGEFSAPQLKARVFNIQRYSLNDGEGIRTVVFFKGCPLKCPWCANPESRSIDLVNIRREAKCLHCDVCEQDADECPSGAFEQVGYDVTIDELLKEIAKDDVFYQTSGGGVTLSGGEILVHGRFCIELLKQLRRLGYKTAIETSGHGNSKQLSDMAQYCDEILFDFKLMDEVRAKEIIGINLDKVLESFKTLMAKPCKVIPRLPLIPGYTLDLINVDRVLGFIAPYDIEEVHLLPFHQFGSNKYDTLGLHYTMKDTPVPTKQEIDAIQRHVEAHGYKVVIGG